MKGAHAILLATGLAAAFSCAPPAAAVWPPEVAAAQPAAEAAKLIAAVKDADFAGFVAEADATFAASAPAIFERAAGRLRARLRHGYAVLPLGELKQCGRQVTLWKLTFKDGGDDVLATLTLAGGKVAAFALD
jgi:hypothetical protein